MKPNRLKVYNKYGGKCAYCGTDIQFKDMQVDHVIPQWRGGSHSRAIPVDEIHCEDNYMPSCRSCNNYKSGNPLEVFRKSIENQIEILRRDRPTFRLAERYGLIECKPKPVIFYYEGYTTTIP
jgi:Restriction endonuclease